MSDKITDELFEIAPKKPNFTLIMVLTGATLLVLFLAAYVLLTADGRRLLPKTHQDPHPTSFVVPASSSVVDA
jgi:hypothetical protein